MLVGHDGQLHPAHLQHYFVSAEQQFEASKLGMWLFLMTEILLFGGMFVAYAIFRAWYPELFAEASEQLDTVMGGLNTLVLLLSSLTVAWAIRGAQTDNRKVLVWNLVATVALAGTFMVVKYFEYTHKFELGIFPGKYFVLEEGTITVSGEEAVALLPAEEAEGGAAAPTVVEGLPDPGPNADEVPEGAAIPGEAAQEPIVVSGGDEAAAGGGETGELIEEEGIEEALGMEEAVAQDYGEEAAHGAELHAADDHDGHGRHGAIFSNPRAGIFFSIYYVMTGIHGLHVIIGMIAIGILAWRARRGDYTSVYYTPVENVGLYWHVVDIIWIFLFPLMYLI
ncbi:MAG: cytochrome c oxidase subunit 3 family protein [Rubricoccaceae bacterium]|nr:cytochrome c oxidase subunit 3 family protein [Rubricoccaceae bacterium]